jgi:hypothetical protein
VPVELHYRDRPFKYAPSPDNFFEGRLLFCDEEWDWLAKRDEEDDGWYLDGEGERLPPDRLLEASPWSWRSPSGTVKLLCRWLDRDGRARFNTADTYPGELYDWVRRKPEAD